MLEKPTKARIGESCVDASTSKVAFSLGGRTARTPKTRWFARLASARTPPACRTAAKGDGGGDVPRNIRASALHAAFVRDSVTTGAACSSHASDRRGDALPERPDSTRLCTQACSISQSAHTPPRTPNPPRMAAEFAANAGRANARPPAPALLIAMSLPMWDALAMVRSAERVPPTRANVDRGRDPAASEACTCAATRAMRCSIALACMRSSATIFARRSHLSLAIASARQMFRFDISANVPVGARFAIVAATNPVLVRLFSASTVGVCKVANVSAKHVLRLLATATESHGDANEEAHRRAADRFVDVPADPWMARCRWRASLALARPTPPDTPCTIIADGTVVRRVMSARQASAVSVTVGMDAASPTHSDAGIGASRRASASTTRVPRLPNAWPKSAVPRGSDEDTATAPAQSPPGAPGSPGYKSSTFSKSRKFKPTANTLR